MVRTRDQKKPYVGGSKTKKTGKENMKKHEQKSVLMLHRSGFLCSVTAVQEKKSWWYGDINIIRQRQGTQHPD